MRNMLGRALIISTFGFGVVVNTKALTPRSQVEWSFLVYIAADNNLAPFANLNINDMIKGMASTQNANVLVQWDQPKNKKTWRYQITPSGKVDVGSLTTEMGYNPSTELAASMKWVKRYFPANKYGVVLWNHGSGIEDFLPDVARGILYDDTQNTCLTNAGLLSALTSIKTTLGKNLDLIATDACLMSMIEVVYQMRGLVNTFVGSQQTIPGNGYPYSQFIRPMTQNPTAMSPAQLAIAIVNSYKKHYTSVEPTPDFTLSAIDVTSIDLLKQNVDQFITAVNACNAIDPVATKAMIKTARNGALAFEMPEYIDLNSFYARILTQNKKSTPKSALVLSHRLTKNKSDRTPQYQQALNVLSAVITDGMNKISTVVFKNAVGRVYAGAQGISIYYPKTGAIDQSYIPTLFAQNSAWVSFLNNYR